VQVPAANLLGTEGQGFRHLMRNLQRERFMISIAAQPPPSRSWKRP
jgi:alkylation response protein AidB-like acyl-CoA dehydrogenase